MKEFIKTQEDLGFCVVCAPIYIFIPRVKRTDFSEAMLESVGKRFLPMSGDRSRFLHCGPRKCHIEHVMAALSRARIPMVNIYTCGCKSAVEHFLFLDDINAEAAVEVDLGFYIWGKPGNIGLIRLRPGSKFANRTIEKFPMLATMPLKWPRIFHECSTQCLHYTELQNSTQAACQATCYVSYLLRSAVS